MQNETPRYAHLEQLGFDGQRFVTPAEFKQQYPDLVALPKVLIDGHGDRVQQALSLLQQGGDPQETGLTAAQVMAVMEFCRTFATTLRPPVTAPYAVVGAGENGGVQAQVLPRVVELGGQVIISLPEDKALSNPQKYLRKNSSSPVILAEKQGTKGAWGDELVGETGLASREFGTSCVVLIGGGPNVAEQLPLYLENIRQAQRRGEKSLFIAVEGVGGVSTQQIFLELLDNPHLQVDYPDVLSTQTEWLRFVNSGQQAAELVNAHTEGMYFLKRLLATGKFKGFGVVMDYMALDKSDLEQLFMGTDFIVNAWENDLDLYSWKLILENPQHYMILLRLRELVLPFFYKAVSVLGQLGFERMTASVEPEWRQKVNIVYVAMLLATEYGYKSWKIDALELLDQQGSQRVRTIEQAFARNKLSLVTRYEMQTNDFTFATYQANQGEMSAEMYQLARRHAPTDNEKHLAREHLMYWIKKHFPKREKQVDDALIEAAAQIMFAAEQMAKEAPSNWVFAEAMIMIGRV